jgi:protease I
MSTPLASLKIAILVTDGADDTELSVTRAALDKAGATTDIVSPRQHSVTGDAYKTRPMNFPGWAADVEVDCHLEDADADAYDALFVPGGIVGPDVLRLDPKAAAFVAAFFDANKPVASICHGPTLFIDAERIRGRRVTSWASVRRDLENAGATWLDAEVVIDGSLVTSRSPNDLPAFTKAVVEIFSTARKGGSFRTRERVPAATAGQPRQGRGHRLSPAPRLDTPPERAPT